MSMRIEIICTGDEVLTGKIVNTNFSYMSQKLEDVGLSVQWETTVGDDRERLLRAFQLAGARADAVIVNGGLGPTVDDLSQDVAAQAAGVELVLNEDWLGESHVDALLRGVEELVPDGGVKLGFRAHCPQLETKLTVRGTDLEDVRRKLAPVEREVRKRLGNFILSEDDATLEGIVLGELASRRASLSIVETFTSGAIAARVAHLPGAERVFRRGLVARDLGEVCAAVGLDGAGGAGELTRETAEAVARAARRQTGATHALAVLIDLDAGADRIDLGGTICLAIATSLEAASRRSRILGGREWVRLGAVEMGLDCLRRYLQGLPVYERIDFEKA